MGHVPRLVVVEAVVLLVRVRRRPERHEEGVREVADDGVDELGVAEAAVPRSRAR